MKQYNLLMNFSTKTPPFRPPVSIMICHTVPDDITLEQVSLSISAAMSAAMDHSKETGNTNAIATLAAALAVVDAEFGGSSYLIQAHGFAEICL